MNKRLFLKYVGAVVLISCTLDITIPYDSQKEGSVVQYAGVNGKHLKEGAEVARKGWRWLKSCSGRKPEIPSNNRIVNGQLIRANRLIYAKETLYKGINDVSSQEEILPKIGEYLSQTKPNEGGKNVINCVKTEANEIKMYLFEQGKNTYSKEKIIRIASESINIAEYDIRAMQENYYKGYDGIEYVEFIIPKRPQYILNGQYSNRIYECMVFNVPKDINGNWEKFKEYLLAFINDLKNRPIQLWDEYMFRRGLAKLNINERDVTEMERYLFAYTIQTDNKYDTTKYLHSETA